MPGENFDRQQAHRHGSGDAADRTSITPRHSEIIVTTDGLSPRAYTNGDSPAAGGFLIGPMGAFYGSEKANTDIVILTVIPWGAVIQKTEEFSHSISTNADEITTLDGGGYKITCSMTLLFTVGCLVELSIQRFNGSVWANRSGGRARVTGVAGAEQAVALTLSQAMVGGWKFRLVATNTNLIAAQVACVANFCSVEILRYR